MENIITREVNTTNLSHYYFHTRSVPEEVATAMAESNDVSSFALHS